jgi:O-antigen/teichoic acid export membrane protein
LLAALVAIPIILKALGTDRFGALSLAWLLIGYFSLFDLGLGRALTKLVAERLAESREGEVPALVGTALLLTLGLGVATAFVVTLPAGWLVGDVLRVPPELQGETREALRLLGISVPFVVSTAALRGLLEAKQCFGLVNAIRIPMGIFSFVGPVLVLPFSHSLVAVVAVLAVGRLVGWAVHLGICLRLYPGLWGGLDVKTPALRPLVRLGGWMTISNVVAPVMTYLDRFLIGALIGLAAVAYYAAPYEMVTRLLLVPLAIAQVLFPAFSGSFGANRPHAARLFDRGLRTIFVLFFPLTLLVVTLAPELLRLWLGEEFARESTSVLRWLAIGAFFNALAQVPFALIQGAGRPDFTARLHLLELPLYVVALWELVRVWGPEGAAIAWTLRVGADAAVLFAAAARAVATSPPTSRGATVLGAALLALVAGALLHPLPARMVFMISALSAFAFLSWLFVLAPDERQLARNLFARTNRAHRVEP